MAKFNGRLATVVLGIAAAFGAAPLASQAATAADKVRVIVAFKQGAVSAGHAAIAAAGGRTVLDVGGFNAVAVELPRKAVALLQRSPHVEFVEEDKLQYAFALSDPSGPPYLPGQQVPYGIKMVQADQVSDSTTTNRTVCIIDSGYDLAHEDLSANHVSGENLTTSGSWSTDEAHHGTHVAGTVAAINNSVGVVGVNPNKNLNLYIVKVFDASGSAPSSVIAKAMLRCGMNGANVVSMSLGGSSPNKLQEKIADWLTTKRNTLVIAAAGNAGNSTVSYPAGFENVVSVAALDVNKAWASFSQTNPDVEIAGPGVSVLSTVPMGTGTTASATVGATAYEVNGFTGSPLGTATAPLANFGLGDHTDPAVAGKVCLIQRGSVDFATKVTNCQASGGVGAIVYNNAPGGFLGTLGTAVTTIPSVSASDTAGADMLTKLGQSATVTVAASNYALFDGTSMATPHVSAVAALVWSHYPNCTAAQMRSTLNKSAQDLGDPGRDVKFGYGLVQAKAALDRIASLGCGN
ncbi:S8 family serine peptidase [Ideonella sp. BN130291]|uniref:S8 family serine peptidase n=1 Tax=Ideonella sp. BN130291 TaxID=3112940 RepID=UPI002E261ECB|nr:S8 family serine peptidase [Ideonella sp. BN130291]